MKISDQKGEEKSIQDREKKIIGPQKRSAAEREKKDPRPKKGISAAEICKGGDAVANIEVKFQKKNRF